MGAKINIAIDLPCMLVRDSMNQCNPDIHDATIKLVHYEGAKDSVNIFIDKTFREGDEICMTKETLLSALETMDKMITTEEKEDTISKLKIRCRELEKKLLLK